MNLASESPACEKSWRQVYQVYFHIAVVIPDATWNGDYNTIYGMLQVPSILACNGLSICRPCKPHWR